MSWPAFWHVVNILKEDPCFTSTGNRPQWAVEHQLLTYLIRMSGIGGVQSGDVAAVAEGTSYLYTDRVRDAIRRLRGRFLSWPGAERRLFLKTEMAKKGFPGCIGICDGSLIRLLNKPSRNGASYWCHKKMYAVCIPLFICAGSSHQSRSPSRCHAQDSDPRHGSQGVAEPPQVLTCVQVRAGNNGDGCETGVDKWKSKEESDKRIEGIMMRVAR
jgi:hypothetical protein